MQTTFELFLQSFFFKDNEAEIKFPATLRCSSKQSIDALWFSVRKWSIVRESDLELVCEMSYSFPPDTLHFLQILCFH